jgi:hypothetical protein
MQLGLCARKHRYGVLRPVLCLRGRTDLLPREASPPGRSPSSEREVVEESQEADGDSGRMESRPLGEQKNVVIQKKGPVTGIAHAGWAGIARRGGEGGQRVEQRGRSLPVAARRGSTLPRPFPPPPSPPLLPPLKYTQHTLRHFSTPCGKPGRWARSRRVCPR